MATTLSAMRSCGATADMQVQAGMQDVGTAALDLVPGNLAGRAADISPEERAVICLLDLCQRAASAGG
jgi:hypothetical protein